MTPSQTLKQIKAINERMAVYERKGLTSSATYQELQNSIRIMGMPTVEIRPGVYRISRSMASIETLAHRPQKLERVEKMGGLREERKRVREIIKKERAGEKLSAKELSRETEKRIEQYGFVKTWAENNLTSLYDYAKTIPEAAILEDNFKSGIRPLSYDFIIDMINKFEDKKAQIVGKASDSRLARGDETSTLQAQTIRSFGSDIKY